MFLTLLLIVISVVVGLWVLNAIFMPAKPVYTRPTHETLTTTNTVYTTDTVTGVTSKVVTVTEQQVRIDYSAVDTQYQLARIVNATNAQTNAIYSNNLSK